MKKTLLIAICALFVGSVAAYSQSLDSTLQKMAGSAVQGYVGPIVSGFGADLNGGWFHKAPSAKMFGFDLEFGVVAMATVFSDANKSIPSGVGGDFSFDATQSATLASSIPNYNTLPASYQSAIKTQISNTVFSVELTGPTIIGPKTDTVKVKFPGQTISVNTPGGPQNYTIPDNVINTGVTGLLDNVTMVPLAAPQLSIGTIVGTQFTFRYLPSVKINSDIGEFKYFGFGIQHNPGIWFPNPLPIDICASFFTQKLDVGTIFSTTATAYGINISKRFGPGALNITPYAGFMLESSEMTFDYTSTLSTPNGGTQQIHVNIPLKGENTSRIILGLSLKLLFININADYNIAKYNSFTGGVMFII
jgi:hypothetical protein